MNSTRDDLLLLVHGTGSARPSGTGDAWWQLGSSFATSVAEEAGVALPGETEVFHWSGNNSELQRRAAGDALLRRLEGLESQGRGYHLIGHSHGGSVIWAALRTRNANRPLAGLRSWTTVGTPFLHFVPRAPAPWHFLPAIAAGVVVALTFNGIPEFLEHRGQVRAEQGWLAAYALLVPWVLVVSGVLLALFRLGRWGVEEVLSLRQRTRERRAWGWYGERHLCVWSTQDEAIGGLTHTPSADFGFLPRLTPTSGWWARRPLRWLVSPFLWIYNHVVGEAGDQFVSARVMRSAQGNDLWQHLLAWVGVTPLGTTAPAVPPEVDALLIADANVAASLTLSRIRRTFFETAEAGGVPALLTGVQEAFAWRELIHTSYFEYDAIREMVVRHLRRWSRAREPARPGTENPASGPAAAAQKVPRPRRTRYAARDGVAIAVLTALVLSMGGVVTLLFRTGYTPYTDRFQVEAIRQARFSRASYGDPLGTIARESADHAYLRGLAGIAHDTAVFAEIARMDEARRPTALAAYGSGFFLRGDTATARRLWTNALNVVDSARHGEVKDDLDARLRVLTEIERSGGHRFVREHLPAVVRGYWVAMTERREPNRVYVVPPRVGVTDAELAAAARETQGALPIAYPMFPLISDLALSDTSASAALRALRHPLTGVLANAGDVMIEIARAQLRRDGPGLLLRNASMEPRLRLPADTFFSSFDEKTRWTEAAVGQVVSRWPWTEALRLARELEPGCTLISGDTESPSACFAVALAALDADSVGALLAAAGRLGLRSQFADFALVDSLVRVPGMAALVDSVTSYQQIDALPDGVLRRVLVNDTAPAHDLLYRHLALRASQQDEADAALNFVRGSRGRLRADSFRALAVSSAARGRTDQAIDITLEMANEVSPAGRAAYTRIAQAAIAAGRGRELRRAIEDRILSASLRDEALLALATAFARAGNLRDARLTVDENRSLDEDEVLLVYAEILRMYRIGS